MKLAPLLIFAPTILRASEEMGTNPPPLPWGRLIGVIVLFLAVAALARVVGRGVGRGGCPGGHIRVVSRTPLGLRSQMLVARVGTRAFLIGQGEKQISLLAELSVDDLPQEPPPKPSFADVLSKWRSGHGS